MTTDPTPESARELLDRHGLPEDVIDGVLCLHAQELAAVQRKEAAVWGVDTAAGKRILEAADLIDPTRTAAAVPVAAPPTTEQTALRDRIAALFRHPPGVERLGDATPGEIADAVLARLPAPADRAATLREAADALGRMDYDTDSHDYGYDSYRDAWNGGVMDGADLLRRLADESAVVPPPALTEEGRLRMQVQALQQDAERNQGLAKVGARCMREGHQGLIEGGRLVLEGWRFALSTALDLGTSAPWEAIHERVKELRAAVEAGQAGGPSREATEPQPAAGACPHSDTRFDRSVCLPPCGAMHQRCADCETAVDGCPNDDARVRQDEPTAYSDGKGRVFCTACPRPDTVDVPLTVEDVDPWELCPSCGRHVVDVARAAAPAVPSRPGTEQEARS